MSSILPPRWIKYNLQNQSDLLENSVNSSKYDLNSMRFFAANVWKNSSDRNKKCKDPRRF